MQDRIAYHGITFDDVLLEPNYSDIVPRDVDVRTQLTRNIRLNIPILSSPMDTVTESELAIALENKQLAGAALDVFENEPLKAEHLLTDFDNVILSAHTAGVDTQSQENVVRFAAECIADVFSGKWPVERIVNGEVRTSRQTQRV